MRVVKIRLLRAFGLAAQKTPTDVECDPARVLQVNRLRSLASLNRAASRARRSKPAKCDQQRAGCPAIHALTAASVHGPIDTGRIGAAAR